MPILPIVTYDDEILRRETEPVEAVTGDIERLIDDMFETMYNSDGVGLAAPQIGKLHRFFVMDTDVMSEEEEDPEYGPLVMINPEIIETRGKKVEMEEGCLSIPGVNAAVTRPEKVTVEYRDREFKKQKLEADGWTARVIQHEHDHLKGVLFLDYLSRFKRKLLSSKLREIEEGHLETDYPLVPKKSTTTS